jgi:hypothetical protein
VICKPCCDGNPDGCLARTKHETYCDNQHQGKEVTTVAADASTSDRVPGVDR